jgi:hypothetical protein
MIPPQAPNQSHKTNNIPGYMQGAAATIDAVQVIIENQESGGAAAQIDHHDPAVLAVTFHGLPPRGGTGRKAGARCRVVVISHHNILVFI